MCAFLIKNSKSFNFLDALKSQAESTANMEGETKRFFRFARQALRLQANSEFLSWGEDPEGKGVEIYDIWEKTERRSGLCL